MIYKWVCKEDIKSFRDAKLKSYYGLQGRSESRAKGGHGPLQVLHEL